jgi:adenosylcobyric acid synthase
MGICGGMQLLGRAILDPHGLEAGDAECLGLLDIITTLEADKTTRQRAIRVAGGAAVEGYEIHHGRTTAGPRARQYLADDLGWEQGSVRGVYLHGLFENTEYRAAFLRTLGWQGRAEDWRARLDVELDRVGALVETTGWARALRRGERRGHPRAVDGALPGCYTDHIPRR